MKKLLLYFLVFASAFLHAQEFKFNAFGQEEGLPQPYVYDIIQAKNGFLFVATGDGLASFGGTKFVKFSTKDGLAENYCSALFYDSKQRLWIGHFEGGVTLLENFKFKKINTTQFPSAKVIGIAEDSKGNIYYASSSGALYVIKEGKVTVFTEEELPPINRIRIVNDILYVASQEGMLVFNLSNRSRSSQTIGETEGKNVTALDITPRNELWIGVEGDGIRVYSVDKTTYKPVATFSTAIQSNRKAIKDIKVKGSNELWISLTGEGLRNIKYTSDFMPEKIIVLNNRNGLKSLFINKIFIDKEENIWFGTTGGGLLQFLSSRFELYNTNNFLPFDDVKTVAVDDSDHVYICDERQLFVFNPNNTFTNLQRVIPENSEEEIRCSFLSKNESELWLGSTAGLYIFDIKKSIPKLKSKPTFFSGKTINYITRELDGQMLVCTTEGLFYLNEKNEPEKVFNTDVKAPHNNFLGCLIDRSGKMWVFSPETPLYYVYKDEVSLEKTLDSLTSFRFGSAVQDKDENIWFATEGDGIFVYDRYKKFKHYGTDQGLSSDFIYGIIASKQGDIIATHKNGISIKYANLKTFRSVNKSNGLPANNVNNNSLYRDRKGHIWMGTTEGLIKYSLTEDKININPPLFTLLSVSFNDSLMNINDTMHVLNYNNYEVLINFIGVSLTNPDGVTYRYMLDGFDEKFRVTDEKFALYPKLSDGKYRFIIYARNSDGFETPEPLVFSIYIKKPFWKEIWFYALVAVLITGAFYAFFKIRTKNLLRAKIELEGLVMEKTAEVLKEKLKIEEANKLLNEKNKDITASISYAKRIQGAILPDSQLIKKRLDMFVFYRPRDIVSGDFYWFSETEKYTYIAAVDCTGHGVPGAFMSLLGSAFLDQALSENKNGTPSELLNNLDIRLNRAFKTREEEKRIGDGMDAIILRIDKSSNELVFAGANRPLYFYPDNEDVQEYKSPIYSVGGVFTNEVKGYFDATVKTKEGDAAYIFSDGFGDQFGGPKGKRYSTRRMKNFFGIICSLPTQEQFEMVQAEFESWKGTEEQMDDICVIGIKF